MSQFLLRNPGKEGTRHQAFQRLYAKRDSQCLLLFNSQTTVIQAYTTRQMIGEFLPEDISLIDKIMHILKFAGSQVKSQVLVCSLHWEVH